MVLPEGADLLGFADDTLVVVIGGSTSELEVRTNEASSQVICRVDDLGLQAVATKTEVVLYSPGKQSALVIGSR